MNIQHTEKFYITPEKQSESSKNVDKFLKFFYFLMWWQHYLFV